MAPKALYQGQGELDFTKKEDSDMSELLGFPPPPGEERALSTDSATSNVERRRTQLREAQRKHRQRRQDQMEDLQTQVHRLTDQLRQAERDKSMLYNILQRVLAQLESQRQAFTSDLPQLVERSVAAHLGTSPSPTIGAVSTSGVSSGGTTEFWSPGVGGPTQYQYGQPGHSPVIGYDLPQRFSLPTCESPIMAPHPSSVSPYERPTFSWTGPGPEREPSLWLNEDEARFLNTFTGVSSA